MEKILKILGIIILAAIALYFVINLIVYIFLIYIAIEDLPM